MRLFVGIVIGVGLAGLLALGWGGPAVALSCAAHPDGSPQAIVSGTEQLSTGEPFFETYDFAIVGTVNEIVTDEDEESSSYGRTEVTFSVLAIFGSESAPEELVVTQDDPGWFAGYPFEAGTTYFVPVQIFGPAGQPNYSFLCDPITAVDDPAIENWIEAAAEAQIPAAVVATVLQSSTTATTNAPVTSTTPKQTPTLVDQQAATPTFPEEEPTARWLLPVAILAIMLVLITGTVLRRKSRPTSPS